MVPSNPKKDLKKKKNYCSNLVIKLRDLYAPTKSKSRSRRGKIDKVGENAEDDEVNANDNLLDGIQQPRRVCGRRSEYLC